MLAVVVVTVLTVASPVVTAPLASSAVLAPATVATTASSLGSRVLFLALFILSSGNGCRYDLDSHCNIFGLYLGMLGRRNLSSHYNFSLRHVSFLFDLSDLGLTIIQLFDPRGQVLRHVFEGNAIFSVHFLGGFLAQFSPDLRKVLGVVSPGFLVEGAAGDAHQLLDGLNECFQRALLGLARLRGTHLVEEEHIGQESEGLLNRGLVNDLDLLFNDLGLFFLGLLGGLAQVGGVALDVELNQVRDFLDFLLEAGLGRTHLLLGVSRHDFALADALLGLVDLVELLLLVTVFAALVRDEQVFSGAEVEGELVVLGLLILVLLLRGGFLDLLRGAHF